MNRYNPNNTTEHNENSFPEHTKFIKEYIQPTSAECLYNEEELLSQLTKRSIPVDSNEISDLLHGVYNNFKSGARPNEATYRAFALCKVVLDLNKMACMILACLLNKENDPDFLLLIMIKRVYQGLYMREKQKLISLDYCEEDYSELGITIRHDAIEKMATLFNAILLPMSFEKFSIAIENLGKPLMSAGSIESAMKRLNGFIVNISSTQNANNIYCTGLSHIISSLDDPAEKVALICLVYSFIKDKGKPFQQDCLPSYSEIGTEIIRGIGNLSQKGWAVNIVEEKEDNSCVSYLLSPKACRIMFKGRIELLDLSTMAKTTDYIKACDIPEKQLFFDGDNVERVKRLELLTSPEKYDAIISRLAENGLSKSVCILLYGGPGLGKTQLAKQIARKSGRDLIIADASRLTCKYVGESAKAFRSLFRNLRYYQAICDNWPILLLNEADGILGHRINAERTADIEENKVQTILLDELENYEGILIATTNLMESFDPAFERRFLEKFEFSMPGEESRAKIWKSMIHELTEEEAGIVARNYIFSGGQIENIAKWFNISSILYNKRPTTDELLYFCRNEANEKKEEEAPSRRRIGFTW